jgi:sterol desaturase/sphingolipid hydroxylase (fatty acid hydroxylase superfamily)
MDSAASPSVGVGYENSPRLSVGIMTSSEPFPAPLPVPAGIRWDVEARKARRRLYPSTVVYTAYALTILGLAFRSRHVATTVLFFASGVFAWTALEYWVHRNILHGRFPDGDGVLQHLLHRYFDHLHLEHHQRPWDGDHINGTLKDTVPFAALFIAASFLAPVHTMPVFVAGLLQAYVVEEWVHQSVHFYHFRSRYFRYIRAHHLYHHSPIGSEVGYGLTNGFWDIVWSTRIPPAMRRALYDRGARRRPAALLRRMCSRQSGSWTAGPSPGH